MIFYHLIDSWIKLQTNKTLRMIKDIQKILKHKLMTPII